MCPVMMLSNLTYTLMYIKGVVLPRISVTARTPTMRIVWGTLSSFFYLRIQKVRCGYEEEPLEIIWGTKTAKH